MESQKSEFDGMNIDEIYQLPLTGEEMLYEANSLMLIVGRLLTVASIRFGKEGNKRIANNVGSISFKVNSIYKQVVKLEDDLDEETGKED